MASLTSINVHEYPPLSLNVSIRTPQGVSYRWGWDDPNPANAPEEMNLSSAMPGGFERFTCTLQRNPNTVYPDLAELAKVTVTGIGGEEVAWQGRLEKFPATAGAQAQVSPEGVGYQAALEDNTSAREIYVDRELSKWKEPSVARRITLLSDSYSPIESASVGQSGNTSANGYALVTQVTGKWEEHPVSEAAYDGQGLRLKKLYYACHVGATVSAADEHWNWTAGLSNSAVSSDEVTSKKLTESTGTFSGTQEAANYYSWALVNSYYTSTPGGEGVQYPFYWTMLAVYGNHGLTLYGTNSATEAKGVLASDVVAHALRTWAPEIAYTQGFYEASVVPSSFVIPQLAFLEPTTVSEIIKQATRFELQDWAVWEGPLFYMNPRGERGREWRARIGPSKLQEAGPQISRLWNGVTVTYQDVTGTPQVIGPPGFAGGSSTGGESEGSNEFYSLEDRDPENPLNQQGIKKWAPLKMGTSTIAGAKAVGEKFLTEQMALETSGQASLTGYVEDSHGITWPAWKVRGGDKISFIDASDTSPRRVVKAEYADSSKTATVQLDQPPEAMQAILERLSASIASTGLS